MATSRSGGTRRGNNEGSIYRRASDGKWCASVTLPGGRRKALYGKTRAEVAGKLTAVLRDVQQGTPVRTNERTTLAQFLERWLEDAVRPGVRPNTYESYKFNVTKHLAPALGKLNMAALTPQDVQRFLNEKRRAGLSPRTVAYLRAILRRALGQALKWGLVNRNVVTLTDPPKAVRHEVTPLSPEQARALLDAVRGDRLEALYTVALSLGLRQGEALGLWWEDVDLEAPGGGALYVRHALVRVGGKAVLASPKTDRSRRTLPLPMVAVAALRRHRARQLEERLVAGPAWQGEGGVPGGLVFTTAIGTHLDASTVIKHFHRARERAGLPPIRFHDLRHTCASLLLAQGVDLRMIMEILGHSTITLTANLYTHILPGLKREATSKLDAVFAPLGGPPEDAAGAAGAG